MKKRVERNLDGLVTEIIYRAPHNHQPPRSGYAGVETSGQLQPENFKGQTSDFNHSRVDASSIKDDQRSGSKDDEEADDDSVPVCLLDLPSVSGYTVHTTGDMIVQAVVGYYSDHCTSLHCRWRLPCCHRRFFNVGYAAEIGGDKIVGASKPRAMAVFSEQ
ncbi:hypothetical protein L6452_21116 [Arctium lappa]|uniref:Uncharacterized protein n=1 Tax=Arctium lappa TaxID=4217 RepID=A0ACB9BE21_ARCLA|nr:hypothetical protein L6452_21116 [Arctium lappa]